MCKDVFATHVSIFKGDKYTKIDFFDMEPTDKTDDKGKIVVEKGDVTRVTIPNELFEYLGKKAKEMNKEKPVKKNVKK